MSVQAFEKLQVLVTGVDAAIARDVARLIDSEGGSVVVADKDAAKLAGLERDLGLYRTVIETARIDLGSQAEVRLWEASLGASGRLPPPDDLLLRRSGWAALAFKEPSPRHATLRCHVERAPQPQLSGAHCRTRLAAGAVSPR